MALSASSASAPRASIERTSHPPNNGPLPATLNSLSRALSARTAEFVRPHRIRVKIGTWNVAASPGTDKDLRTWFVDGDEIDKRLAGPEACQSRTVDTAREPFLDPEGDDVNAVRLVGGDKIGLYVLGLQEVVDLNAARTTLFTDSTPIEKWNTALSESLPEGYELVVAEQLSGILLLIYASPEAARSITNVSSTTVGTGLLGYMGNKGGIAARLVMGEATRIVFVNSHLASGTEAWHLERRCWDYNQIVTRTQFDPISNSVMFEDESGKIGDEDFAFWLGDLNFRLEGIPGDDIKHILGLHTRGEYDITKPPNDQLDGEQGVFVNASDSEQEEDQGSDTNAAAANSTTSTASLSNKEAIITPVNASVTLPDPEEFPEDPEDFELDAHLDPSSLQATLDSLLPHDQLRRMIKERKAFHEGWREGPITFLPTYKYDMGTVGLFDSSEKRRPPSWCDRILFRTRKEKEAYETRLKEEEEARRKDQEMKARGMEQAGEDDEVLFDYDPDSDRDSRDVSIFDYDEVQDAYEEEAEGVVDEDGFVDRINLEIYTSHQRITSSDHKPTSSILTLYYNAVVPELKAKVHAEVARQIDRAENEGRPGVTIIVDGQSSVTGEGVDFGGVGYLSKTVRTLTIANTSQVPATLSFVERPRLDDDGTEDRCPPWMTTGFTRPDSLGMAGDEEMTDLGKEVTLDPGDTLSAVLEIFVSELSQLMALNGGLVKLEDVLVLRITDGRDHFIPVRGNWLPTCFGRSIDELIRLPNGGIRNFAKSSPEIATSAIPSSLQVHASHPCELFRLIEAIEKLTERAVADENMVEGRKVPRDKLGWPLEESTWMFAGSKDREALRADVIDALDRGANTVLDAFPAETPTAQRLEVVAEVMALFLKSLVDGVVTASLWARIETSVPGISSVSSTTNSDNNSNRIKEETEDVRCAILDILTSAPNHHISFVFLMAMAGKVVAELAPIDRSVVKTFSGEGSSVGGGGIGRVGTFGSSATSGRRSLGFRRSVSATTAAANPSTTVASWVAEAVARRMGTEEALSRVLGRLVCRVPPARLEAMGMRERRAVEDKMARVVKVFL